MFARRCAIAQGEGMVDELPLAQVNLVVSDLAAARDFYRLFGWDFREIGGDALVTVLRTGCAIALHTPEFARKWNPAYTGGFAGTTVMDLDVPTREAVDDLHDRVVEAGYTSRSAPTDMFWGVRYAIVEDPDGNALGLQSPQDGSRSTPIPD